MNYVHPCLCSLVLKLFLLGEKTIYKNSFLDDRFFQKGSFTALCIRYLLFILFKVILKFFFVKYLEFKFRSVGYLEFKFRSVGYLEFKFRSVGYL